MSRKKYSDESLKFGDVRDRNLVEIRNNKSLNRIAADRHARLLNLGQGRNVSKFQLKDDGRYDIVVEPAAPRRTYIRDEKEAERLRKAIIDANPSEDYSLEQIKEIERLALERKDVAIQKALDKRKSNLLDKFAQGIVPPEFSKDWVSITEQAAREIKNFLYPVWELGTINGQYVAKNESGQLVGNIYYLRNKYLSKSNPNYFSVAWGIVNGWNRWASTFVNKSYNLNNEEKQIRAATSRLKTVRRLANRLKTDSIYVKKLDTKDIIRQEKLNAKENVRKNFIKNLIA